MNSYNHYAYGAVGAWMYRSVAGLELDPLEPGYRHIIFRPRPGGSITWAEASIEIAHEIASIHWEKIDSTIKIDLIVPQESHATLLSPEGYGPPKKFDAGQHQVTLKKISTV